jgi:hypothetical protein
MFWPLAEPVTSRMTDRYSRATSMVTRSVGGRRARTTVAPEPRGWCRGVPTI